MSEVKLHKPTKEEQKTALDADSALDSALSRIESDKIELKFAEAGDVITFPRLALELLSDILQSLSKGKSVRIVSLNDEITTQEAADMLGCSRPHLVNMLEEGEIPYYKIGKHRRVKAEDVLKYKKSIRIQRKKYLKEMMEKDKELGLYDS